MKLRENNFKGDTQKYHEIHAINSVETIGLVILSGYGNHIESNVRDFAALK